MNWRKDRFEKPESAATLSQYCVVTYRLKKLQRASNVHTTRQHILELVPVIYKKKAFLLYFFKRFGLLTRLALLKQNHRM